MYRIKYSTYCLHGYDGRYLLSTNLSTLHHILFQLVILGFLSMQSVNKCHLFTFFFLISISCCGRQNSEVPSPSPDAWPLVHTHLPALSSTWPGTDGFESTRTSREKQINDGYSPRLGLIGFHTRPPHKPGAQQGVRTAPA